MAQIDEFFFDTNRVEGITEADYERAKPYVEAAQAFAQSTYQSIYIIDYFRKNFLYVSDNPLFLCGHTADEVRQMGYGFYINNVPADEQPMLTELNRAGLPCGLPCLRRRAAVRPPTLRDVLRLPHPHLGASPAHQPQDYAPRAHSRWPCMARPLHRLALVA